MSVSTKVWDLAGTEYEIMIENLFRHKLPPPLHSEPSPVVSWRTPGLSSLTLSVLL